MGDNTALATPSQLKQFNEILKREDVQERFRMILDKRTPQFMASLLTVYSGNQALQKCSASSILTSAAKAAILDLPIEPSLGFAYIVPFKGEAAFIEGYKGMIQLALRTRQYEAINAGEVYQGETVEIERLSGKIKITGKAISPEVIGYFAYFRLKGGYEKYIYMTTEQVHAHGKQYGKSYDELHGPWKKEFPSMAKKTVLRQLLSKWGLMSIEMLDEDTAELPGIGDERFATPQDVVVPPFTDVVDVVATEADAPEPEPQPSDPLVAIYAAVVEAKLAENEFAAKGALDKCATGYDNTEKAIAWMRLYRGWRDAGLKSDGAAAKANNGEAPR